MRFRRTVVRAGAVLALGCASSLPAQEFPGFGSLEGRVGIAVPDDADVGLSAAVELGLGYFRSPSLQTVLGFSYFQADVERTGAEGSITAVGGRAGLRFDPFGAVSIGPYLGAFVTAHNVTAEADVEAQRQELRDVFGGFVIGGSLAAGLTYALDFEQRFKVTAEGRRVFVANVSHWAAELGLRIVPRGRDAYAPVFRPWDPRAVRRDDAAVIAATEAERARAERERAEAERLRVEQERLARMTDEERARAQRELDEQRARAEAAEAERRTEAEARVAAEREAERARAEASEAERRAREAEERLYGSLVELDRLIANIAGIRETERGLVIVLGHGLFGVGQHTLSPPARAEVGRIAAVLAQYPERRIAVEGHTDSTGSEALNQRLSEQRAQAVHAALIAHGIDPGRIELAGYGQHRPIADNATAEGRAQNRRVEILILGARRPAATR